jgi:predicted secreted protein
VVDMRDDAEVTDAGEVGHWRRALAGLAAAVSKGSGGSLLQLHSSFGGKREPSAGSVYCA